MTNNHQAIGPEASRLERRPLMNALRRHETCVVGLPNPADDAGRPGRSSRSTYIGPSFVVGPVVRRKRQYGRRKARVEVAVLLPAVANEYEVAPQPAAGGGRDRNCNRSSSPAFMMTCRSSNPLNQLADVSEARVVADKVAPARRDVRQPAVDRSPPAPLGLPVTNRRRPLLV